MYNYHVKENPTELYYERHRVLVGRAKNALLARKAHINKKVQLIKSSRAVTAALGLVVAALMMVGVVLVGASGPAHAATTFTVTNTTDANNTATLDVPCARP
jgi:hypothetical protein